MEGYLGKRMNGDSHVCKIQFPGPQEFCRPVEGCRIPPITLQERGSAKLVGALEEMCLFEFVHTDHLIAKGLRSDVHEVYQKDELKERIFNPVPVFRLEALQTPILQIRQHIPPQKGHNNAIRGKYPPLSIHGQFFQVLFCQVLPIVGCHLYQFTRGVYRRGGFFSSSFLHH